MKALWLVLAAAGVAGANGRPAATSTITFRRGHPDDVVAGLTFGAVITHDRGATWHWFCEDAIGYGGMYDPAYAYTASGKIFATTFAGLTANTDGCVFAPTALGSRFVSSAALGPDGTLYVGASDSSDSDIHASTDDGATFPAMTMPGMLDDWWESIAVAPSDARRLYLTGYRYVVPPGSDAGAMKQFLAFTSDDGGATWTPMPLDGIATNQSSVISIAGIDHATPTTSYARVTVPDGIAGDALYRSSDAGQHWTEVLATGDSLALAVRANGDLVVGTPTLGAQVSHDRGDTWSALAGAPHINCLAENELGELWACTRNAVAQGDGAGIMKTADLATWTPVLRFQDIVAPVACPPGTVQLDRCQNGAWCATAHQLMITSTAIDCPAATATEIPLMTPPKGCCDAGAHPDDLAIAGAVGMILFRRRRRCSVRSTASPTVRSTCRSC